MKDAQAQSAGNAVSRLWTRSFYFIHLTKPGLTSLVLFTTFVGFFAGTDGPVPFIRMCHTLIGTALVAGGAAAFNMYAERQLDVLMKRTALRPIPSGRLQAVHALVFALVISAGGFLYLYILVNHPAGILSAVIFSGYLFLYTPLKTRTWLSTFVGAIPGALPAVLGWTAAAGSISRGAWTLFAIIFLWQMPHFYAIGWMHRKDYEHAGFYLLPAIDSNGRIIRLMAPLFILVLQPVSLLPFFAGIAGTAFLAGSVVLGLLFFAFGIFFGCSLSDVSARSLFLASAIYLPALLLLMILDKTA